MKLVFLYGPPSVGKLTIAKELAAKIGWGLFHNHLTVDLALSLYAFGTPGFIDLREQIWTLVFRRALADKLPGVIFTFNPESTVRQHWIDDLFEEVKASGGEVLLIHLTASEEALEKRIGSEDRTKLKKLSDVNLYRSIRDQGFFDTPIMPIPPRLTLNTEELTPRESAERIFASIQEALSQDTSVVPS